MTLRMKHVSKTFKDGPNAFKALNDASLNVNRGEFVAVIGPSGSGKSTFLSTAGALLSPTSGSVEIDGTPIAGLRDKAKTRLRLDKIGFVFQTANLIPYLNVTDQLRIINVMAKNKKRTGYETNLLNHFGLEHRTRHFPNELSGGERQRVAIARALVNEPDLILADEPTASLDSKRGREVVELIASEIHERGKAGIMVTHDERVLDLCDRVFMIKDGQLMETETIRS
ncbi:ABC transporter ATP-binding protein [Lentibacillus salicampi]|uniref:Putative hemin import ATP-binding protein HrtA n=1 Tax=Lentibacillus salicampi TaxID=175306 RepID=A0A4Y9ADC8_9BACI|nr:ABC transporter ATP-binding protein [Lentibacillus salicampi]TFJ92381.1 ABC transporter ATP-binding protein [Lentibacillus salicampi]